MPKAGAAVTVGNAQRLKATRTPGRCSISGVGAVIRAKDLSCHGMAWIRICKSRIGTVPHDKNGREARVRQRGGINTGTMVAQECAPNLIKRGLGYVSAWIDHRRRNPGLALLA